MYEKAEINNLKNRVTNLELKIMNYEIELQKLRMDIIQIILKKKDGDNH